MDEVRERYAAQVDDTFYVEVAFYHGWMAALDSVAENFMPGFNDMETVIPMLRDIANSDMAAEIGG